MGKGITVRGNSVEQAVEVALSILNLDLSDVHIHVNKTAEFNEIKEAIRFAEVTVTPLHYKAAAPELLRAKSEQSGVRIRKGRVEVQAEEGGALPSVEAGEHVLVFVNGKKIEGAARISETDTVHIRTIDELTRAQLSITVREHGALALLTVTPGEKITRSVRDTSYVSELTIEAEEVHEVFNDLSQQMIRKASERLGIQAVLDKRVLWEACETTVPYEAIIARGIFPKPGLDGDVEVQLDVDGVLIAEEVKVNYRERASAQLVQEGQLIASLLPPIPGQQGVDVFGNEIAAADGRPAAVQLGKNVSQTGNHLFAACPGKLLMERIGDVVEIDVLDTLTVDEVNLTSGNVRFDGDVEVKGSVSQGCLLEVTGDTVIGGEVQKAEVHVQKRVRVAGHVSSASIIVGPQISADAEYAVELSALLPKLQQLTTYVQTVGELRDVNLSRITGHELKKLFRIGLGNQYALFQENVQTFALRKEESIADHDWKRLQKTLYSLFVNTMSYGIEDGIEFLELTHKAKQLIERHRPKTALPTGLLRVPYAVNSILKCAGTIEVTGNGLAQCNAHAQLDLVSEGICRGGELSGDRHVSLRETGSKRGGQTIVRTTDSGSIVIGIAHPGTILIVGNHSYQVTETRIGITASLQDGVLTVQ